MGKKHILCIFIWIFSALTIHAEPIGYAPDTSRIRQVELEEVVISSFKYSSDISKLPVAGSKIDRLTIENQHITGIKDIGSLVPNLFIPDYGSKLTSPVYIRGVGAKINSPSVGLYVDGIPYFEKSAFDFDLNEIESVEVLRGPQGTLYGRNTMGGLINIRTKSPLRYQETLLSATVGNYDNLTGRLAHYGNINNTFGYAVSGDYTHLGGYFTNQYTGKKADNLNAGSGRLRFDWRIKPNLALQWTTSFDGLDQGGYPYAGFDPKTQKAGAVNYNDYSLYRRTVFSSGASLIYMADRFSLNAQTAFQHLSDRQGIDQDFTTDAVYYAKQLQKQTAVSEEITVKSASSGRYKWLFGAFAFYQGIDNEVILEYKKQNYTTDKLYDIPTNGISFYHQSVFDDLLIDRLSLTLGIRYDYEKASNKYVAYKDVTNNDVTEHSPTEAFDSKMNFSQLTPKVALQYRLFPEKMFYISATKGYKTGGFNTSFEREEDRSFAPEYSWNYEIGSKMQFFQNRFQIEACLFYIDWKNQQIYQTLPSGKGSMLKNAGRSESKGAEISLLAKPFNGLNLQANWGYTHAVFKEYQRSETLDYGGKFLPLVPKQTFSFGFNYAIPVFKRWFDRVVLDMNYTGIDRLYWNEDNAVSQPYYGQLNGNLMITKGLATFSLWAKNITNESYSAFYFESMGKQFVQKGKPFTIGATISVKINDYPQNYP
ncbi:TonB-dependent receptor [Bacteroidia bacterium]|nr:TonB-dependent receptor [Bacteroidia bacterium]GHT62211.1 TonB-dependent receptor [Bacteroidia bacterium]